MKNVILISLLLFLRDGVFAADEMKVTEGDSLTLPTGLTKAQSIDRILWLYGSDKNIIAQIDQGTYSTNVDDERFKDNLELDKQTGSLTIKKIHIKNTGLYQLDINRGTTLNKFNVKVFASLPTPDIDSPQCAQTPAGSSSPRCVFQCSVQASDQTTLSWYRGNIEVSSKISDICSSLSLRLEVNYEDKNIYSCMVNNPISNKTKHLDITHLCQLCEDGLSPGAIAGIVVAVLLPLLVVAAVIYMRYRRPEREKQIDSMIPDTVIREEGECAVLRSYYEIKIGDQMRWSLVSVKETAIASMSEKDKKTKTYWYDRRFRGRLQLDPHTGSLTIRNLRKTDAGVYVLEIKSRVTTYRKYEVIISGEVKTVSVKEGDDVTLDFSEDSGNYMHWMFAENDFIDMNTLIENDNESEYRDVRFRGRLDKHKGSLTIKDIRTEHTGLYGVLSFPETNYKIFSVVFDDFTETSENESVITGFIGRIQRFCGLARIEGVFGDEEDEMKTLLVMEGDDLKLNTETEIQTDDEIILRFGAAFRERRPYVTIARFSKPGDDEFKSEKRGFKDRLQWDLTGPLTITITDFRNTDCGDYYVQITNKKKKSFKSFTFIDVRSDDAVKRVLVMKGESINLVSPITDLHKDDQVLWTFGLHGTIIADTNTSRCDERFRNRVTLDKTTGSLTIIKGTIADAGDYYRQFIRGNRVIHQTFNVTFFDDVKQVSVVKGESINLVSPVTDLHKDDQVLWTFGRHAMIIVDTNTSRCDERFRDRVTLDKKTGSLTIRKSTRADAGEYNLQIIRGNSVIHHTFDVFVCEPSVIPPRHPPPKQPEAVTKKSVKEGKSVTLETETEIQEDDLIQWMSANIIIAEIRGGTVETHDHEIFRDRLKLDEKTGSLTITNMRIEHIGVYQLQIISSRGTTNKRFNVMVVQTGIDNEERNISVEEGKSVTLETETEIQKNDLIQWRSGNILIAEISGGTVETHDDDGRFRDRLKLDEKTGSLTIRNMRKEHTGYYKLKINSSRGNTNKRFKVVVVYKKRVNDSATVEINEEDLDGGNEQEGMSLLVMR